MSDISKIIDLVSEVTNAHMLNEALSPEDLARIDSKLASPDMRPNTFDITFEAWIDRINTWGKTKVVHVDPEFRSKNEITPKLMIARMHDSNLLKMFGQFKTEQLDFNKLVFYRDYQGMDGKKHREEFIVTNDLSKIKSRMNK